MSDKKKGTMTVLLTQCIVCGVILLLAVLVRVIGGEWAGEAKDGLFSALADNTFADALFDPPVTTPTTTTTTTATTTTTVAPTATRPASTTAVSSEKRMVAAMAGLEENTDFEQRATEYPSPVCLPLTNGVLTSGFGRREHPITGEDSTHTGWDIAADEGTPIYAMYTGTVTETGSGGSYGNYVQIEVTPDFAVIYAHCQKLLVKTGDTVTAGKKVALVGSTGVSTGNHLHLEFLHHQTPIDPALLLSASVYGG